MRSSPRPHRLCAGSGSRFGALRWRRGRGGRRNGEQPRRCRAGGAAHECSDFFVRLRGGGLLCSTASVRRVGHEGVRPSDRLGRARFEGFGFLLGSMVPRQPQGVVPRFLKKHARSAQAGPGFRGPRAPSVPRSGERDHSPSGMVTETVVPLPSSLSRAMSPPCACTTERTIDRPRPRPFEPDSRAELARKKRVKS